MDDLIVVGCGDHYKNILSPSLEALERSGEVRVLATVDLTAQESPLGSFIKPPIHVVRSEGMRLSKTLSRYGDRGPTVILAHAHDSILPPPCDEIRQWHALVRKRDRHAP